MLRRDLQESHTSKSIVIRSLPPDEYGYSSAKSVFPNLATIEIHIILVLKVGFDVEGTGLHEHVREPSEATRSVPDSLKTR